MIIPAGFVQVNWQYQGGWSQEGAEWTIGFDLAGFVGSLPDLAAAAVGAYQSAGLPSMHTPDCVLANLLVKEGPNATGPSIDFPVNVGGTLTGEASPPNTAWLIQKQTALGGRAGRGRVYFPGINEVSVDPGGVLDSVALGNAQGFWDDFHMDLTAANLDPVLLHGVGSPIAVPTPILQFAVDSKVATQRRRLR